MYKDKDKQRQANRLAKQRQRQGMTKGVTVQGMTSTSPVIPDKALHPAIVACINRISEDDQERKRRTAAAMRYQRLFPERQYKGIGLKGGP